ncbi:MAG TPA: thioredoxin family protein [Tessaracoccus flavescens]|uniref:Thioredoxin family protein n=1 Tax=Tessaracoccus flavescens TaxID=399497 RepID=A0A921ER10_9ACTN|nr:thioredoxin family protein [Tessaracoccus flavescens]
MALGYNEEQPTREEIDETTGNVALEFGQNWCGYCKAAKPDLDGALAGRDVERIKVADGKGLPLGRSFQVKLWPTLVLLRDGVEVDRLVRPQSQDEVAEALDRAGFGMH